MKNYKLFIAFVTYCLFQVMVFIPFTQAQTAVDTSIEMADSIRSDGKIYVVVLVVLIAFTGLMIYATSTQTFVNTSPDMIVARHVLFSSMSPNRRNKDATR